MRELKLDELRRSINPRSLGFETTASVRVGTDESVIVGQEKALKALETAVGMGMSPHDHIYVAGHDKIGKAAIVKLFLRRYGKKNQEKVPKDWVCVYNFDDPYRPILLSLPAGQGQEFKADFEIFFEEFPESLKARVNDPDNTGTVNEFRKSAELTMTQTQQQLFDFILQNGFIVGGIDEDTLQIGSGKTPEEVAKMSSEERADFQARLDAVNQKAQETTKLLGELTQTIAEYDSNYFKKLFDEALKEAMMPLKEKYNDTKVAATLISAQEYLSEIAMIFTSPDFDIDSLEKMFTVNVLVDNSETDGLPIVQAFNCDYGKLFGVIERTQEDDSYYTDHTFIRPGLIHQANGGYLIIRMNDLLMDPYWFASWQKLMECLRKQESKISNFPSFLTPTVKTLDPEIMPLNIKVILLGDYSLYEGLCGLDDQFGRLFQKKVELDSRVIFNKKSQMQYIKYIATFVKKSRLKPLTAAAVARVVEHGCERAENGQYLSLQLAHIRDLLREASFEAKKSKSKAIDLRHVEAAIRSKIDRSNLFEDKFREYIEKNIVKIQATGERIGQINGLAVFSLNDHSFATPTRITAVTFRKGNGDVVSIERNIKMAGPSHNKGSMILSAYLKGRYGRKSAFPLSASITFEQEYDFTDGDSATQAELIAILSSLSDVPVRQNLAITGSMNQLGDTQAIGGVNEKIAGWYFTCKSKGLIGTQGVVIPEDNAPELMLPKEIVEAVASGQFHIYTVTDIGEATQMMTGRNKSEIDKLIYQRLTGLPDSKYL